MMNFFTRPLQEVATTPRGDPAGRLAEIALAYEVYRIAEKRWDAAKLAVARYRASHPQPDAIWTANDAALLHCNALKNEDPQLTRLCGIERAAARSRNEALRAWLRAQGKLTV